MQIKLSSMRVGGEIENFFMTKISGYMVFRATILCSMQNTVILLQMNFLTEMGVPPSVNDVMKLVPGCSGPLRSRIGGLSTDSKLIVAMAVLLWLPSSSETTNVTTRGSS